MNVLGTGIDVVDIVGFRTQLDDLASGFVAGTFTLGEQRDAARSGGERVERLAVRFAAKEAFVKAWSGARRGRPHVLARVDLRQIEVVLDAYGRPGLRLHGEVREAVATLTATPDMHVSLSHDGPVATAIVILAAR